MEFPVNKVNIVLLIQLLKGYNDDMPTDKYFFSITAKKVTCFMSKKNRGLKMKPMGLYSVIIYMSMKLLQELLIIGGILGTGNRFKITELLKKELFPL